MISRLRREPALVALLLGSAFLTVACQKVPLLAPSGSTITLTASATALPVNGSTDVIAQMIEAGGTPPHSGTLITFTTNLGTIQPSAAETDISGRVTVKYLAGSGSGIATITAISGGVSASGTNAIKIAVGSAAVAAIALSASPTTLPARGGTTTIAAVVSDAGGNPLPSVPVTFSTDNGSLATGVVTTDTNGRAQTTLTTSRTAKVTATAGVATTSGTTTTAASTNTITITVNSAATVSFGTFSPTAPVAGQPVSFTLTINPSTTGGAAIQSVVVNFGDGRSQTLGAVAGATSLSHTYDSPGTYTLTATATDSNGDAFPAAASITVGARPGLVVTVTAPTISAVANSAATFNLSAAASSTSASISSIVVNFGDTSSTTITGNATSIAHTYTAAGIYVVTATATDSSGATGSGSTTVVVASRPALAVTIKASASPVANSPVVFEMTAAASSGATISSILVNFGDGSTTTVTTGLITQRTYTAAGTYVVTATATDSLGATGSGSTSVVVGVALSASFTYSPSNPTANQTITFNASGSTVPNGFAITVYTWDFGDGSPTGSGSIQTHTYAGGVTYVVRLTVTDNEVPARSASTTRNIPVTVP